MRGDIGFGGEESAGASFLDLDGQTWTTDKDGILLALLASEIKAVTGRSPSEHYADLEDRFGKSYYARIDADANREQKARLKALSPDDVSANTIAGEKIEKILTKAPGNGAAIGGIKVMTENAWFAARPSGTEDKYKIYAESLRDADHLAAVQEEARHIVDHLPTPRSGRGDIALRMVVVDRPHWSAGQPSQSPTGSSDRTPLTRRHS